MPANNSVRQRQDTSKSRSSVNNNESSSTTTTTTTTASITNSTTTTNSTTPLPSASPPVELLVNSSSKWKSSFTRAWTTLVMLGGFIFLFSLGHIPLFGLLFFCQVMMFKEVKRISSVLSSQKALPSFRPLHWYWFLTAIFFAYGRVLDFYFHITIPYHSLTSFLLYVFGVVLFVFSLEKGYYRFQFEMFGWVQLTLLLVVIQSTFIVVNMFQGLIWFVLPAFLIISNDSWAYVFGFFFGKTPLISISPKKTWEGFLGAMISTVITGVTVPMLLAQFDLMICPKHDLTLEHPTCVTPSSFVYTEYPLPNTIIELLQIFGYNRVLISLMPIQLHGFVFACFASFLAPFGGFFASGLKRAFGIKDFGESIPGHGGVTDRMDCQIFMGLFTFVYFTSFVVDEHTYANSAITLATLTKQFLSLNQTDQITHFQNIQQLLTQQGKI